MKSIKFRSGVFKSIGTMMLVVLVLGGCAGQSGYQSQVQPQPVSPEPSQATTPSQPASISTVEVEEQDNSVRVVIKGSEPLTYTVLQKEAPLRLVVDVAGAKLNAPPETLKVEKGAITEIWPSEVDNNGEPATRIEIGLNTASANYEVLPSGNNLFIDFPTLTQTEPVKKAEGIVDVAISDAGSFVQVDIMADGKIEDYKVFALKEPTRLVVDLPGLMSFLPYKTQDFPSPLLNKIRYGEHQDYLRMVLDSPTAEVSSFDVVPLPNGITLFLGTGFEGKKETLMASAASVPKGIEPTPLGSTEPEETFEQGKEEAPVLLAKAEGGEQTEGNPSSVGDPSLESETQTSLAEASPEASSLSDPNSSAEESSEQPQGASQNEVLAQKDETTSAPEGTSVGSDPVSSPATDSPEVSSPSASTQPAEETDEPSPQIAESTNTQPQPAQGKEVSQASVEPPSFNPVVGEEGEGLPQYTGEHISLDFKDADVRNILRLIADVSNLNIVAGDDVQGTVTVKLNDVPWDQALDVILLSNNLGKTLEGNILRVVPLERLNRERQAAISDKETADKLEPLKKGLIPVSYADAKGLKEVVLNAKALSPRGSIEIDPRTNIMIVIDIEKNIQEVRTIVDQLDTPTPQVLIEAKVVQINPTYTKELGVTWDSGYSGTHNDGLFGIGGNQGVDIDLGQGTVTTKGNIIDLAPAVGQGIGGAISFGFLNPKFGIFQKIAALEKEEKLEIVSSPRIMTIDNEEAIIEQGVDLPYLKLSEEGVTSTDFKKATLSLKVIPHVTADRSILMEIEVKKDQKSAQTGAGGEPGIDTRRAETKILVRNGDTVVIGGIYEETTQDIHNSIPFFGRLPLVSWMFKNTKKAREKTELIVFITPTIITFPKATQKEMALSSPN